jgi:large subunit ribosomal protein L24
MNTLKIKKGDTVQVISGKDRGRTGKVLSTVPTSGKLVIEGLNMATRHVKPRNAQQAGGITKQELPLAACKVMVVCPKCHKPTRIKTEIADGKKIRKCKHTGCGAEL